MTDQTPPPTGPTGSHDGQATSGEDALDELASAYLDAMATPAEIARVEADEALIDLVGRFASVERGVDAVPPPPPGVLDTALSAALDVFDADLAESGPAGAPETSAAAAASTAAAAAGNVTAIASQRRVWWTRVPLGAVAAVVVVIALIGVAGLIGDGTTSDDTAADTTGAADRVLEAEAMEDADSLDSGDDAATQMGDAAALNPAAADAAGGTMADPGSEGSEPRLRMFDSEDELLDQYRQRYAGGAGAGSAPASDGDTATNDESTATSADDGAGSVDPCDSVRVLGFDDDRLVTVERVAIEDRNATAVVAATEDDDDGLRLGVVADDGCSIILLTDL